MTKLEKKYVGILQSLVEEFETHRLPRLLHIKDKVDAGGIVSDIDIEFLDSVIEDAKKTMPLTVNHPEIHEFCLCVVHLYKEISEKALENEAR